MIENPADVIRYQYDNHLGSASLELDNNANIISYEEYHPFGTTSYRSGRTETETSLKRYKYVGKERDEETGLYYYGARYYAAWICRFVSVDPMKEERVWLNPYNYVQNNPINRVDPTGMVDEKPPEGATSVERNSDGTIKNINIEEVVCVGKKPVKDNNISGKYILSYRSSMQMHSYDQVMGDGKINPIFSLSFGSNKTYSFFSLPNLKSAGQFIYQANIPDIITYNSAPGSPLPDFNAKKGWYPNITGSTNANRTGASVGALFEWGANGVAGAVNSVSKNKYLDTINTNEAFSLAFNEMMKNNKMITEAFNLIDWSLDFNKIMENGNFDIRNFQADVINYITDGNLDMVNFQFIGFATDFNQYRNAVYQTGEKILHQSDINYGVPKQNTFSNNAWDTYVYMGR